MALKLHESTNKIPLVGPKYQELLKNLGIYTVKDLLFHLPFRYEDYSKISEVSKLRVGEKTSVLAHIKSIKPTYTKSRKLLTIGELEDHTGTVQAVWFNQPYLSKSLKPGDKVCLSGEVSLFSGKKTFVSPDFEIGGSKIHTGKVIGVYPETYGISSKWLRARLFNLINNLNLDLTEYLPPDILTSFQIPVLDQFIKEVHFPDSMNKAMTAIKRASIEELLLAILRTGVARNKWREGNIGTPLRLTKQIQDKFINSLPFELTNSQLTAMDEILTDLAGKSSMNRLLQGDVGSGKTVVASIASLAASLNGKQTILLCPTEILAKQHFTTFDNLLGKFGIGVSLFTASVKHKKGDVVIGTHALLYDSDNFKDIGLVIIDEQHKFGVEQRTKISQLTESLKPHVLTMTATPIPRTLALTIFGDLEVTALTEKPKGREKITTWVIDEAKRLDSYRWVAKVIKESNKQTQAFVVCPLIEESEHESLQSVKSAKKEFEDLSSGVFKDLRCGLLHGKLKPNEKDKIVNLFRNKEVDVLITTSVIEVGIDIPSANIVVIEGADRFGLAALHQIRGRVGRGEDKAFCILVCQSKTQAAVDRLKKMETVDNGLELAEFDLKLRGLGELAGTKQHGYQEFKYADLSDIKTLEQVRKESELILKNLNKYPLLKSMLSHQLAVNPS